jgi:methylase of polypeptide subunit release factors
VTWFDDKLKPSSTSNGRAITKKLLAIMCPFQSIPSKDVVWVPSPDQLIDKMLRTAQVTDKDLVYDLGAGDGKIAIAAALNRAITRS